MNIFQISHNAIRLAPIIFVWAVPIYFMLAIFARSVAIWVKSRREGTPQEIPTEPIVLMTLGMVFLVSNWPFVNIAYHVAKYQIRILSFNADFHWTAYALTLAAVALVASFSKVFWTHLNLEEDKWGPLEGYRDNIWKNTVISAFEFLLRVAIAISVVLLQKIMATLRMIPNISDAIKWSFSNDAETSNFSFEYNKWLTETASIGAIFFLLVLLWLLIAATCNIRERGATREFHKALRGTLFFALPGLLLSIFLVYDTTGFSLVTGQEQPELEVLIITSGFMLVPSAVIVLNLVSTIWQARTAFLDFWKEIAG